MNEDANTHLADHGDRHRFWQRLFACAKSLHTVLLQVHLSILVLKDLWRDTPRPTWKEGLIWSREQSGGYRVEIARIDPVHEISVRARSKRIAFLSPCSLLPPCLVCLHIPIPLYAQVNQLYIESTAFSVKQLLE